MKYPEGEYRKGEMSETSFEAYLTRGNYDQLDLLHSSYDTVCETVLAAAPSNVIAIDGPSNAGKTSLTQSLAEFYTNQGIPVSLIPLDYFLTDRETRNDILRSIASNGMAISDYSDAAWTQQDYHACILSAKNATQQNIPHRISIPNAYNRLTGRKELTQTVLVRPGGVIITEGVGVHAYHSDLFDVKIRVDTRHDDILLQRLYRRELQKPEGAPSLAEEYLRQRYDIVDAPHTAFLRAVTPNANCIVETTHFEEIVVYKHR